MENTLITAIIITYKRPKLLKRAVRSILAQSYKHFEVLIADNNSGKETEEAIEKLKAQDKRVKLLQHPINIGLTATLQSALTHVSTPYVSFLNDDDFAAPYFFEETLPPFSRYPDIAFCGGGAAIIDQSYLVKSIRSDNQTILPSGYYPAPKGFFAYLYSTFGIGLSSLLFKTEILKKLNGFDLRIRNGSDEDPISKCASRYPVYLLTERPYFFAFHHQTNLSKQIDHDLYERECECLYANLNDAPFSPSERKQVDLFFKKRRLKIYSSAFNYFYSKKEFQKAALYAEKIETLQTSFKWKRKKIHAKLSAKFSFLDTLYTQTKSLECKIRYLLKNQKKEPLEKEQFILPNAAYWKDYALQLETD